MLQLPSATLAVIEREEQEGDERKPLIRRVDQGKEDQRDGAKRELVQLLPSEENEHGCQHTPNAVVHGVIGVRQKRGKRFYHEEDGEKRERKQQPCIRVAFLHGVIERIDQDDGEGERDQNALVKRAHRNEIDDAAKKTAAEHLQKIAQTVFRVARALCNHVSEDREGKSADHT